ncbi:hypothetical protein M2272_000987 [Mycobacterium frederiksbergense]|uniref:DUF7159 domain-containing protein n=1 Tax=Mycolicibacterium frederiksbergense TaxID=117567 RepID=A0ABT6KUG2_9MYCO|nr:hypothetical protein [Mycolicibacterium frederiksbergense]MDH6194366.1 hypothetical protein [Mycolicibacterium frederiksbergense]
MKTVLGLSVTARGIAWVLVDGGADSQVTPLDDDAFVVEAADQLAARAAAAVRSARVIAASSGQDVTAVGVTWSDDVADQATQLLHMLAVTGFDDVRVVPEPAGPDAGGADSQLSVARAAAQAVATNAVPPTVIPARHRPADPPKYRALRAAAAVAAAVGVATLTVGSQFSEPTPNLTASAGDVTGAGTPQVVTAAIPRVAVSPPVVTQSGVEAVSAQAAERAHRESAAEPAEPARPVDHVEPVALVDAARPTASPVVQAALPVPPQTPEPAAQPHLPAAQPHLPTEQPHIAVDPAPGPALLMDPSLLAALP